MHRAMVDSARRALQYVLGLREGERVLVVTDDGKRPIGQAFFDAAVALGCPADLYLFPAARPLRELPPELAARIPGTRVAVNCFAALADETPFRLALLHAQKSEGRRVGHAPGITPEMMTAGPMDVDYRALQENANRLICSLRNASYVRVTAASGTDLTIYVEGRPFETDVVISAGHFGNLPCGEVWCAPVETLGEGTLVCDGSIGDLGAVPAPVAITLDKGRAQSVSCPDKAFERRLLELLAVDAEARTIGELGIGVNPGARLVGNLLEDEKAYRTAHVAFGNNDSMPGGTNRSRTHRDFLFREPTITVHYADGSAALIVEGGLTRI